MHINFYSLCNFVNGVLQGAGSMVFNVVFKYLVPIMAGSDDAVSLYNPSICLFDYKLLAFSFGNINGWCFVTILDMLSICSLESYIYEPCSL